MQILFSILSVIIIFFGTSAHAANIAPAYSARRQPPGTNSGMKRIIHNDYASANTNSTVYRKAMKLDWNLGFEYPQNWEYHDEINHVYVDPIEGTNLFGRRNANVVVEYKKIPRAMTLTAAHNDFIRNSSAGPTDYADQDYFIPAFSVIASGSTVLLGKPAVHYTFTGERGSQAFKAHAVLTTYGNTWLMAYLMSPPEYFDIDMLVLNRVLETLKVGEFPSGIKRPNPAQRQQSKVSSRSSSSSKSRLRSSSSSSTKK